MLSIIHQQLNREAQEDEGLIVMSKLYLSYYLNDGHYDVNNSIAELSSILWRVSARTHYTLLAAA